MNIRELLEDIEASVDVDESGRLNGEARRVFLVDHTSPLREQTVLALLPAIGSQHPRMPGLYVTSKTARPIRADRVAWRGVCIYRSVDLSQWNSNPLLRPARVSWSTQTYEVDMHHDVTGRAILNSAGDFFDPPIRGYAARLICRYTRNVQVVPASYLQFVNAINSDTFTVAGLTVPPRHCRCEGFELSEPREENGVTFIEWTIVLCIQGETWQPAILDQGLHEFIPGIGRVRIRINGEPITEPVLLDGHGRVLPSPSPERAVWLTQYRVYRELPFSYLVR